MRIDFVKNILRRKLESQEFADFYSDNGPLGQSITGEFERGTPESNVVEQEVDKFLDKWAKQILAIS